MKVYSVDCLAKPPNSKFENYAILFEREKDAEFFGDPLTEFCGIPFSKKWRLVELYIEKPKLPIPDFFHFRGDVLILNEKARIAAGEALEVSGELLPLRIENLKGHFFLHNIVNCLNVLDHTKTIWKRAGVGGRLKLVDKPAFIVERFGEGSLFKIPENGGIQIYCLERTGDPDDGEFKAVVEKHKLTGINFELVWTDTRLKHERKRKRK